MATLVLNKVNGAELEATSDVTRVIQSGHVDDIDIDGLSDPDVLVKVQSFIASSGYPFGTSLSGASAALKLTRLRVRGEPMKIRRANIELTYETNTFNATPTLYMLRDRSFAMQQTRCTIPGSRIPLVCEFQADSRSPVISDVVFYTFDITARAISVTVLQYGRPATSFGNYGNYVNDSPWPSGGMVVFNGQSVPSAESKPKGYWKLQGYATEYDRNKGMTLIQTDALTQGVEDWSVVGMLRNEQTGKYPFASLSKSERSIFYQLVNGGAYAYGIIWPTGEQMPKGIQRIGPYPMTNFFGIFGF